MKARIVGAILIVAIAGYLFWPRRNAPDVVSSEPPRLHPPDRVADTPAEFSRGNSAPRSAVETKPAEPFVPLTGPAQAPAVELGPVRTLIRDYRLARHGNPVGNNAEITAALREAKFLPASGFMLNGAGELVDRWGTPYFFHQLSAEKMEIRSAGPDKQTWNADDLVVQ